MSESKEITVCLLSGIGNTVMVTPLVEALRRKLGYKIKFLIHPDSKNLVGMVDMFECSIGKHTSGLVAVPILWRRCEPKRVSKDQILADDLDPRKHHESEANMTIARKLGYKGKTPAPKLYGVNPDRNNTVVIATGCRPEPQWKKKKYPHWRLLCEKLAKKHNLSFLGTGDESERWMGSLGLNLCGKLKLKDSINWIAGSRGVVGIDNGLTHVSAALNKQTSVLYGPTMITKNKQIGQKVTIISNKIKCSPCQLTPLWNKCRNYECMDMSPEYIFKKLGWDSL